MLSIFIRTGYTPEQWKKCISCAIEKDPSTPNIAWLRIIHIYENDLNLMNKLLWGKRLIHHAEKHKAFGNDQYGSRLQKSCIDVVVRKMLTYDYARLTQTEMCTLDNDATSCFDRQLPNLLSIICGKFGMPSKICGMYANILNDMQYHIKTSNGISDDFIPMQ